jgi:hypothetical protein
MAFLLLEEKIIAGKFANQLFVRYSVVKSADAGDLHFDNVAGLHKYRRLAPGNYSTRRACGDNYAVDSSNLLTRFRNTMYDDVI